MVTFYLWGMYYQHPGICPSGAPSSRPSEPSDKQRRIPVDWLVGWPNWTATFSPAYPGPRYFGMILVDGGWMAIRPRDEYYMD